MILTKIKQINKYLWEIPINFKKGMQVPARIYASREMLKSVEDKAIKQLINCASLPGVFKYVLGMPDIHSGYGPPIGGVGAIKLTGGVISPGFVGFDENCGVRLLRSNLSYKDIQPYLEKLAQKLQKEIPSGLGKGRKKKLNISEINNILKEGVHYLVKNGFGEKEDIENCEEEGYMKEADPSCVSERAKKRGRSQVGTLGSGNHFLEIQMVKKIFNYDIARQFDLFEGQITLMIHSGSRGLGHQNCADYLRIAEKSMEKYKIKLPDKKLACFPFESQEGQNFFKAMSAACNYAWANRQMITFYARRVWKNIFGSQNASLSLLYDIAHNIAKIEEYKIDKQKIKLIIHRKGATRALPAGHPNLPEIYKKTGQPVLLPGSMGTSSYICVGTEKSRESFYTVSHGAGRIISRRQAIKTISGNKVIRELEKKGIIVKCFSKRGIAEEAPKVYKDIDKVVKVIHQAGLAKKVAQLIPLAVIKGE